MSNIPFTIELSPEELGEKVAQAIIDIAHNQGADSEKLILSFVKAFDATFESYDTTLDLARFFVREIAVDHASDGEEFDLNKLFGDIVKEAAKAATKK